MFEPLLFGKFIESNAAEHEQDEIDAQSSQRGKQIAAQGDIAIIVNVLNVGFDDEVDDIVHEEHGDIKQIKKFHRSSLWKQFGNAVVGAYEDEPVRGHRHRERASLPRFKGARDPLLLAAADREQLACEDAHHVV